MDKGYLICLYIAFGFITLLVILTKGRPLLVRHKVMLGLLILSLTGSTAALVSCRTGLNITPVQKDIWQTEGWVDEDTYRILASADPAKGQTKPELRKKTARERARLNAQYNIIEKFKPHKIEACGGMAEFDPSARSISMELTGIVKGGSIILERYDEEQNCEIIYEVKARGLKKKVLENRGEY